MCIPLDQRGNRTDEPHCEFVEMPDGILDRAVVGIDEKRPAGLVGLPVVSGEVDLPHAGERIAFYVGDGIPLLIGRRDEDVVDVEQQAASAAPGDFGDEVGLRVCALGERDEVDGFSRSISQPRAVWT